MHHAQLDERYFERNLHSWHVSILDTILDTMDLLKAAKGFGTGIGHLSPYPDNHWT